ncbi:MAG: hypothetical protein ACKOCH_11915, partial [Bacteroidota bacterium]
MHEYAKAFVAWFPEEDWPDFRDIEIWETLKEISGMDREKVEKTIGLAGIEPLPVAIHHFFNFPDAFKKRDAELFSCFERILAAKS